jgi:FtsP/CotA-like multicopper oxidase with cupredoxin domain
MNDGMGMGQLVLGITVPDSNNPAPIAPWHADRRIQLEIQDRESTPRFALRVRAGRDATKSADPAGLIGPPIVLTRGEPVEIEVINKTKEPTAIHWHGIELESYYDGVPGWTGGSQTTPAIASGESFVVRMTPPRAGTFIYHTHWHDGAQLLNGLYGPLIVLPPGEKLDSAADRTFVFSLGDFGALHEIGLINGSPQSKPLQLETGKKYRFRLINISTNNQAMQVSLRNTDGAVEWRVIAKDGADLPPSQRRIGKAQLNVTVGETYDVEFTASQPKDLLLDLLMPAQKIHATQTLVFTAPVGERSMN